MSRRHGYRWTLASGGPAPGFLIYSEARVCYGPRRDVYFLLLDFAVAGGWRPSLELAEYARHQTVIPSKEAAMLADGLETTTNWLRDHPHGTGELQCFRPLADCYDWLDTIEFFRGGDLQIDDSTQLPRVRPWGLWRP